MEIYKGLFVGLTTIDIQYFVDVFPASNQKIKTNPPDILIGGPATNAAVAFAHLNKSATLATAFGNNSFKTVVKNDFINTKIEHIDLVENQETNPVIASVITSKFNGDRNIFTHNPNVIEPCLTANQLFTIVQPDILLLDGFYPEFSIDCAKLAQSRNIPVVLDGGSWKPQYLELFDFTDVIICSNDFYPPGCSSTEDVFCFLLDRNIEKIAISRGNKSIVYQNKTSRGVVEVENVKMIDTLGAGDFLHGAFCYYFLKHHEFKIALELASQLATLSCKFSGTRKWLNV